MSQIIGSIVYGVAPPMPPKPSAAHRLTNAERQARLRERKKTEVQRLLDVMKQVARAKTIQEARDLAISALIPD